MRATRLRRLCLLGLLGLLVLGTAAPARAGERVEGKHNPITFDGRLWGAYRYTIEDPDPRDSERDRNLFAIDLVHLTLQGELGGRITGRVRTEIVNRNDGAMRPVLERADVLVEAPFGAEGSVLRLGQTEGIVTDWLEKPWGYRIVSETTTHRWLGLQTSYLGVGWSAGWAGGRCETDLLVANRASYVLDVEEAGADPKYKTLAARAYVKPIKTGPARGIGLGGYAQFAPHRSPSSENRDLWFGGHAFFDHPRCVLGAQYDARVRTDGGRDVSSRVLSGFGRCYLTDRIEVFARVDAVDFDTDGRDLTTADESPDWIEIADQRLAQTVFLAGASRAWTKTLRGILDLSVRSFRDDVVIHPLGSCIATPVGLDTEVVLAARIEARL